MSASRLLFAGLAVSCGVFAAHATSISLNLRPGLWEMTSTGEATGALPISQQMLDRLPPDRRAKVEAALAASRSRMSQPRVFKQCITAESLKRGIAADDREVREGCHPTVISSTASVMDVRVQCSNPRHTTTGTFHFETSSPEAVSGTVNMTISEGAQSMTMKRVIAGKWLGADCGDVKAAGQ